MSFIKTFSGKHFYYDRINKDDIVINDIAVSLSNICRFAGHLSHFYSVAQHAVLCSQLVPQEFAFEALMHDATEAYCQDIPAPLKRLLPDYKRMEEKIDAVIREKYGLPPVMSTPVKYADLIMLATERRDLGLMMALLARTGRYPGNRDVQSYSTVARPYLWDVYGTL
ncbi:CPS-53 (KpLE1) prophage protein [Escherichia coli]|uniref:CPS-53 (KpLE1) prophage protein n=1 Tax=Escherichia coli TaxID=562 RepID=A0A484YZ15_ECOLX|nr:CPS-53 (KpLE1) prophage protein [Escherichia coli]